ncbi:MAG: DUF5343 domain-containing protein [Terracidiphilus sp.]|nr:DUF5343 domain-containing protein [Terracidiphilus sp.]
MEAADKKKPAPPYVAYKTLRNFLDRFKQGLPGRIDRGLMGSMSGAAQSQVITALRFLGMISENGLPTKLMQRYATGEEEDRRAALFEMLMGAYPFLFDTSEFSIKSATASQLREAMEANTSATGETLARCIAFVKDAAQDAGFSVSQFILQKKGRAPGGRKKAPKPRREEKTAEVVHHNPAAHSPISPAMPALASLMLSGLFQRLPKPGSVWPRVDRDQWLQTLQNVLLLEYPES